MKIYIKNNIRSIQIVDQRDILYDLYDFFIGTEESCNGKEDTKPFFIKLIFTDGNIEEITDNNGEILYFESKELALKYINLLLH
jgi:hypothetical protein